MAKSSTSTTYTGEHYKEHRCHSSAADSGLGYNLKMINSTHNVDESCRVMTTQGYLPVDVDTNSVSVSVSGSTVDSMGTIDGSRATELSGVLLPSKYQLPFEESTPKFCYSAWLS